MPSTWGSQCSRQHWWYQRWLRQQCWLHNWRRTHGTCASRGEAAGRLELGHGGPEREDTASIGGVVSGACLAVINVGPHSLAVVFVAGVGRVLAAFCLGAGGGRAERVT